MRACRWLGGWLLLAGCGGDEGPKDGTTGTDSGTTPSSTTVVFRDRVEAGRLTGALVPDHVRSWKTWQLVNAAMAVVAADGNVQYRLTLDNGAETARQPVAVPPQTDCWALLGAPRTEFTLDYSACDALYGMKGGVFVKDHPAGPVLFEFQDFSIQDRAVSGTIALSALDADNTWRLFETDSLSPNLENRVQLGATVDGVLTGVRVDGSSVLAAAFGAWSLWAVVSMENAYTTATVVQGATDPGAVDPAVPPPVGDRTSMSLDWRSCRCPTAGLLQAQFAYELQEVAVDLDDLKAEPDGFDDPEVVLPFPLLLEAPADLVATGCGTFETTWDLGGDQQAVLDKQQLVSLITVLCDTQAISDREHCIALLNAADDLESLTIDVPASRLGNVSQEALLQALDDGFCAVAG